MIFSELNFNVGSFTELRGKWRAKADALIPVLQHRQVVPESLAELVDDPEAWQGMRAVPMEEASKLSLLEWNPLSGSADRTCQISAYNQSVTAGRQFYSG